MFLPFKFLESRISNRANIILTVGSWCGGHRRARATIRIIMMIMIAVIVMVTAAAIAVVVMTVRFGTIRRFGHFGVFV